MISGSWRRDQVFCDEVGVKMCLKLGDTFMDEPLKIKKIAFSGLTVKTNVINEEPTLLVHFLY
jgi:hypothetical protein